MSPAKWTCVLCLNPIVDTDALRVQYFRPNGERFTQHVHGPCVEQYHELLEEHRRGEECSPLVRLVPTRKLDA